MVIRWQIIFKDIDEKKHYVDIYDATKDTATVDILTGAANPISTDEQSDDDFYMPIRTQSGYIRFVIDKQHEDILSELMPTTATDRPVVLRDDSGRTEWVGFLTGEQYSQPWKPTPYTIELPIQGIMSAMEGVNFIQNEGYTSLQSLVDIIAAYLPVSLGSIYPDSIDSTAVVVNYNFQEYMSVEERDNNATTEIYDTISVKEVMEYFCKYFGVSCRQSGNSLIFVAHDATSYADKSGTAVAQSQHELSSLKLRGASNKKSFSSAYGVATGEFDTGANKIEDDIFSLPSNFSKTFSTKESDDMVIHYYDSDDVQAYVNGVRSTDVDMKAFGGGYKSSIDTTKSFGQITTTAKEEITKPSEVQGSHFTEVDSAKLTFTDGFYFRSTKGEKPCTAMTIKPRRPFYFAKNDTAIMNIRGSIVTEVGDKHIFPELKDHTMFRIYAKVKVGDYWLHQTKSEVKDGVYWYNFDWSKEESTVFFVVKNGNIALWLEGGNNIFTAYPVLVKYGELQGIIIKMPADLMGRSLNASVEFLANAYPDGYYEKAFKDSTKTTRIEFILSNFSISTCYAANINELVTNEDKNKYVVSLGNAYTSKYQVSSTITTRRGMQHGTGLLLDSSHAYVTRQYDLEGLQRRAKILGKCREILTVVVDGVLPCTDTVTWHGKNYIILSQSVQWRDCETTLKLLNVD